MRKPSFFHELRITFHEFQVKTAIGSTGRFRRRLQGTARMLQLISILWFYPSSFYLTNQILFTIYWQKNKLQNKPRHGNF